MNFPKISTKARLLGTVSTIALMAGCTGPFDPNGTIGGGIQIGPDGKPTLSINGDFVIGSDPKEELELKPHAEEEATEETTIADGIIETADALGIDPLVLAIVISYETAGSFDPLKRGPTTQWGTHRGLIQFGELQAERYGVDWNNPVESQLGANGAVARYMRAAGVKPGHGLLDAYSAVNAGAVGRYNRSDAHNGGTPGSVRDKVNRMEKEGHVTNAQRFLRYAS